MLEYEAKVVALEDRFDNVVDSTERQFETIMNEQMSHIDTYLTRDRAAKEEAMRTKKLAVQERQRELKQKFESLANNR